MSIWVPVIVLRVLKLELQLKPKLGMSTQCLLHRIGRYVVTQAKVMMDTDNDQEHRSRRE